MGCPSLGGQNCPARGNFLHHFPEVELRYRRLPKYDTRPQENFVKYALYILFFPQLIAGPIIRYHEIADQLTNRFSKDTIDNQLSGLFRFVIGLAKKVLIANSLGQFVDEVFAAPVADVSSPVAWLAMIGYSFQIYYDFAGYSDMAIGIARMLGFHFPENFRFPYIAQNITEFWRRWHITLSRWMKEYLYIPLGGNRISVTAAPISTFGRSS